MSTNMRGNLLVHHHHDSWICVHHLRRPNKCSRSRSTWKLHWSELFKQWWWQWQPVWMTKSIWQTAWHINLFTQARASTQAYPHVIQIELGIGSPTYTNCTPITSINPMFWPLDHKKHTPICWSTTKVWTITPKATKITWSLQIGSWGGHQNTTKHTL